MAWKKYTPVVPAKKKPAVSLSVPDRSSQATPRISINDETLKVLGWKVGTSLELLIGEGDHDGKIRIVPMKGAPTELRSPAEGGTHKRSFLRTGRMPVFTEAGFKGDVSFEIDRGGETTCTR